MVASKDNSDLQKFLIRLGATIAAVVLVMYLAKVWFVDQRPSGLSLPGVRDEQVNTFPSRSKSLTDTIPVISWQEAAKHYGEYATVEGTIVATHNSGKICYLNFHPDYQRYFTAVIFASTFSRFPSSPENYYLEKKVRVSGYIKEYQGKPEVVLNDPSQIEILK